jgi:hypothetical protein
LPVLIEPTEAPWRRAFWFGDCDARVLGLFRLAFGSVILFDLCDRLRDFNAFYTDAGLAPRADVLSAWARMWRLSAFDMVGTPLLVGALYALAIFCVAAYTVGWRTRLFSVLAWLSVVSLDERNLVILDGGDGVMRVLLFWGMFADLGAAYSLDVLLGQRDGGGRAPALPLRVMQLQVGTVYLMAAVTKTGLQWKDGTALYHALQLSDWARGIHLLGHPALVSRLTHGTLWIEWGFPIVAAVPIGFVRALAIGAILMLHGGIFSTMRVGLFSTVMPVTMLLFVYPRWIDWLETRLGWRRPRATVPARGSLLLHAFLIVQFLMVMWTQSPLVFRLPSLRRFVGAETELLSLWQNWAMFAPNPLGEDGRWEGPGKLSNGAAVDVLAEVAPGMLPDHGFFFHRWVKYRSELYANSYDGALRMFASYLCRSFNRDHPPDAQLAEFDLVYWQTPTKGPEDPPRETKRLERWHQRCLAETMRGAALARAMTTGRLLPSPRPSPAP